jgi:hypothetical protein
VRSNADDPQPRSSGRISRSQYGRYERSRLDSTTAPPRSTRAQRGGCPPCGGESRATSSPRSDCRRRLLATPPGDSRIADAEADREDVMSSYPEQLPRLRAGWHLGPDDGTCLMEHVSQVEGLKFTDTPRCTDPLLATLAQLVNDAVSDRARPQLVSFARRLASRPRVGIGSAPAIVLAVLGPALERRPARRDLRRHQARARRRAAAASRSGSGTDLRTRLLDELYRRGPARHALMSAVHAAAGVEPDSVRNRLLSSMLDAAIAVVRPGRAVVATEPDTRADHRAARPAG